LKRIKKSVSYRYRIRLTAKNRCIGIGRKWRTRSNTTRNLAKKFSPDPSTLYLVIVVTNKQIDRETNAGKNIIPRFHGDNNALKHIMVPRPCLYKQEVKVIWQGPFAVHTNRANVYSEWNISFKYCQIYATGTLLTYAMTLWCHHYCLHAAVCKIHHFKLFFA